MKLFTLNSKEISKEIILNKQILTSNELHQIIGGDGAAETTGGIVIK